MYEGYNLAGLPKLRPQVKSRSLSAENPDGKPGAGGQAASNLGVGRKGRPCLENIPPGATVTLADIKGSGVIRHIWLTVTDKTVAGDFVLRDLELKMYWDDVSQPAVAVPLGDFFCNGHGRRCLVAAQPITVNPTGGYNCYFPMPFRRAARIEIENQHAGAIPHLFYQISYTEEAVPDDAGYFCARWTRANPLKAGQDLIVLDTECAGGGQFAGAYFAWTQLGSPFWWGEGELKFFIDDDSDFPTICGTGTEDYVGGAWCFGETYSTAYLGYPLSLTAEGNPPLHGLYRFHVPDPLYFATRLRVTVQDIGHDGNALFEREDDVSAVAYWYQAKPPATSVELPPPSARAPRW
jgi:hypothetical protein